MANKSMSKSYILLFSIDVIVFYHQLKLVLSLYLLAYCFHLL